MPCVLRFSSWARAGAALVTVLVTGCFTADLDPERPSVFACETQDDCPEAQSCINQVCEAAAPPVVTILAPEPQDVFPQGQPDTSTMELFVNVSAANLTLVDPSTTPDHVFGQGHIRVTLDGEEIMLLTSGAISGGMSQTIEVENTAGGHRLSAAVLRNDRRPYDHDGSRVNRLFWLDDGDPHVAITIPWPGTEFPLESTGPVLVAIETLNFTLAEPANQPVVPLSGHAHIHYDASLRGCFDLSMRACDEGYQQLIGARTDACSDITSPQGSCSTIPQGLPSSGEKSTTLTVTLRRHDHDPYFHPFVESPEETDTDGDTDTGGDTDGGDMDEPPSLVLDEIMISRVREPASP